MAFSLYFFLDPKVVLHSRFWRQYYDQHPYLLKMADGYGAFADLKPHFEEGDQKFYHFMKGVDESKNYLLDISADDYYDPSPKYVKEKFLQYGFYELADSLTFNDGSDHLEEVGEYSFINVFRNEVGNLLLQPKQEFLPFDLEALLEDWLNNSSLKLKNQFLVAEDGNHYYCPAPQFLNIGDLVCFYLNKG